VVRMVKVVAREEAAKRVEAWVADQLVEDMPGAGGEGVLVVA